MGERGGASRERAEVARRVALRRAIALSALGHAGVAAALILAPAPRRAAPSIQVTTVDLVTLAATTVPLPPKAPRRAERTPPRAPSPPDPPPRPDRVILPTEPRREREAEPPKPQPPPVDPPSPPPPQRDRAATPPPADDPAYEDVLAELRRELGRPEPRPPTHEEEDPRDPALPRGGTGQPISAETTVWLRRARMRVNQTWVLPVGFRSTSLEVEVAVELDASGRVQGTPRVVRRSGNPWYDRGVVRAIEKADPLPPPPEAGEWPFIFRPEDLP